MMHCSRFQCGVPGDVQLCRSRPRGLATVRIKLEGGRAHRKKKRTQRWVRKRRRGDHQVGTRTKRSRASASTTRLDRRNRWMAAACRRGGASIYKWRLIISPRPDNSNLQIHHYPPVHVPSNLITFMADQAAHLSHAAGEAAGDAAGQAQQHKQEAVHTAQDAAGSAQHASQEGASQAGGVLQQAGAQVQQVAQGAVDAAKGAAEAVKNATGLGGSN